MITNTREYQITRAQMGRMAAALEKAKEAEPAQGVHPTVHLAELAALESEVERLKNELESYEALVEGRHVQFEATNLQDLPEILIQARIANRMSQKQLAGRLGIHEQQVQRYEANRYRAVSFDRLLEVAQLLGVHVEQKVILAAPLLNKIQAVLTDTLGFSKEFIASRLLLADSGNEDFHEPKLALSAVDRIRHIFGWSAQDLQGSQAPVIPPTALGGAVFKVPPGRNAAHFKGYTAYAFRIACGAARCAEHLPIHNAPSDWKAAREQILAGGEMSLSRLVDWAWELGVVIIPLLDRAAFHGAFWRIDGRNVIVIKQRTESQDRLMHDVLHEMRHASQEPQSADRAVIEETLSAPSTDQTEIDANTFASDVLLMGQANELVKEVAAEAGNYGPALKSAVKQVARRRNVTTGALANHLAWVLQQQQRPLNWWGAAHNLQQNATADLEYARTAAFRHLVPPAHEDIDTALLFSALRATEEA